jgi:hypothetical protein
MDGSLRIHGEVMKKNDSRRCRVIVRKRKRISKNKALGWSG